jgi:y4mF family transcriptional regulator
MENINLIAEFVRQRRKKLGLTQVELSQKAGVGLRFVRELEQEKEALKVDKINQVLALFGHTLGPVPKPKSHDHE